MRAMTFAIAMSAACCLAAPKTTTELGVVEFSNGAKVSFNTETQDGQTSKYLYVSDSRGVDSVVATMDDGTIAMMIEYLQQLRGGEKTTGENESAEAGVSSVQKIPNIPKELVNELLASDERMNDARDRKIKLIGIDVSPVVFAKGAASCLTVNGLDSESEESITGFEVPRSALSAINAAGKGWGKRKKMDVTVLISANKSIAENAAPWRLQVTELSWQTAQAPKTLKLDWSKQK